MITLAMPPSYLRNDDKVGVESLTEFTTAHRAIHCPGIHRGTVTTVTVAQALVFLHAQWCPHCMGRRG